MTDAKHNPEPSDPLAPRPSSRRPTVLIVDDDEVFVELIGEELEPHFTVEWARDGKTALDAVLQRTPDVIFLDQGLPDTEGVALIDELRKVQCDTPVVMLTASQDVYVAAAAMRAGAIDFIIKDIAESFYEDMVPTATRAVEKWNNEKELEYLRDQQEEQNRQTKSLNLALRKKNEQLERAYQEIEASRDQLRQKNQRLSELYETAYRFVDNVSHEMRTPLTVIKEFLAIVMDGLAGELNEQQREYLGIAAAKTHDLARMVDDMLDISKIEAGLLRVDRRRHSLREILKGVEDILQQKASSSHIEIQYDILDGLPELYCDREKIGRVLINLVVNAMKFSPEHSKITVSARMGDAHDEVRVSVQDEGPGIPEEHLQTIFERFKQLGQGTRSSTKGFGLGLNIVRELVYLNMGDVTVHSRVEQGSTFSFTIPVFDHRMLMERFLHRLPMLGGGCRRVVLVRASAPHATSDMSFAIKEFVSHHLSAFDLSFERPWESDVVLVAACHDPAGLVNRLTASNQEELRHSPGSTVDLAFEVLHDWQVDPQNPEPVVAAFERMFERYQPESVRGT